ncbi:16S rRNA (adenine(1518)-N(6)/adenine(1519)-N(6))-dimethyltransferase RsmA [Castellaniella sp.]|uniref:16S rRNA (adenine(1518)-N(6)/adenine(1519)-N(6))- dimethyltransferase RsmA n=1 Tax=Castellaniella sp. TaxID=1955812 RepID=UPI00356528AB
MARPARKRFGQHFLTDLSVVDALVRAIDPQPADTMVEIGPGRAALTAPLLERIGRLTAIELDRDLAAFLRQQWPASRLQILCADALTVDFGQLAAQAGAPALRIVGNLPYNVSTPLLFHLRAFTGCIHDQHFMLQREVVERMVAQPGSSAYGRLSIQLQRSYRLTRLFDVPPAAFDPPPRVMSSVVRMRPWPPLSQRQALDEPLFEALLGRVFEQRRKMLRGSLGAWARSLDWQAAGVLPTARPQELSIAQFLDLADALTAAGVGGRPPAVSH